MARPYNSKVLSPNKKEDKFIKVNDVEMCVGDCPNVIYFRRNYTFNSESFMYEDTFNFGRRKEDGGGRSVMLPAIRILYSLGFRNIFLLGCDFNMKTDRPYSFEESVGDEYVSANMSTYMKLSQWFTELKPHFDKMGLQIFNCNKNSNLNVFPFVDFDEAFGAVTSMIPSPDKESTLGMYRKSKPKSKVPVEVPVKVLSVPLGDDVKVKDLNPNNKGKFTEEELEFIRTVEDSALQKPSREALKKIRLEKIAERVKLREENKVGGITLEDKERLDPLSEEEVDESPEDRGKRILEEYLKSNQK